MANTPASADHDDLPPAMDYAQHEGTYLGFVNFVKYSIVSLAFVVLALYAFIEGHSPLLGAFLLVLSVLVPIGMMIMGGRRRPA